MDGLMREKSALLDFFLGIFSFLRKRNPYRLQRKRERCHSAGGEDMVSRKKRLLIWQFNKGKKTDPQKIMFFLDLKFCRTYRKRYLIFNDLMIIDTGVFFSSSTQREKPYGKRDAHENIPF
jgi:hypothetical protein